MLEKEDLEICARTVAELGTDQPDEVRASLAWVIRNRITLQRAAFWESGSVATACENILREATASQSPATDLPDADWRRIKAATSLVWAGDMPDRTCGAVACHRHDASPAWARKRTPTALLGAFLFFR